MLGNPSSDVVITIETDGTVCNCFASLAVRPCHNNAIGFKSFLELVKEPRGWGETTDKPDGLYHPFREDNLVPDRGNRSFYGGLEQLGDVITVNAGV